MKLPTYRTQRLRRHPYPLPPPPPQVEDWDNRTPGEAAAHQQWEEAHGEVWRQLEKRLKRDRRLRGLIRT